MIVFFKNLQSHQMRMKETILKRNSLPRKKDAFKNMVVVALAVA